MLVKLIILSIGLVALAILGLGFSIFFRKNGKFPETGVGHNPEMRKLGLNCARAEELKRFKLQKDINSAKSQPADALMNSGGCAGCSCTPDI